MRGSVWRHAGLGSLGAAAQLGAWQLRGQKRDTPRAVGRTARAEGVRGGGALPPCGQQGKDPAGGAAWIARGVVEGVGLWRSWANRPPSVLCYWTPTLPAVLGWPPLSQAGLGGGPCRGEGQCGFSSHGCGWEVHLGHLSRSGSGLGWGCS